MAEPVVRRAPALAALLLLAAVSLAAACDAAVASPCATAQLQVSVVPLGGAASHRYDAVVFTNTGPAACSLHGYPGVAPVDAAGLAVGDAAAPDPVGADPQATVALAPGASASALVTSVSPGAYPAEACGAVVRATAADVTAPGAIGAARVPFALDRCVTGAAPLTVSAVRSGVPDPGA